jgi:hypothetical protein
LTCFVEGGIEPLAVPFNLLVLLLISWPSSLGFWLFCLQGASLPLPHSIFDIHRLHYDFGCYGLAKLMSIMFQSEKMTTMVPERGTSKENLETPSRKALFLYLL